MAPAATKDGHGDGGDLPALDVDDVPHLQRPSVDRALGSSPRHESDRTAPRRAIGPITCLVHRVFRR